jgi:preprotein translocase subunit YajC
MHWVIAANGAQGAQPNPLLGMLPFILIIPIFYFLLIRPQQKKQKQFQQMVSQIKKNDKVVTSGGIHGLVLAVKEHTLTLKIADNVKIELDKSSIVRVVGTDSEGE